ncbi:TetR/AcrR family transcriptional regulator C-terminal domain-containing protein [Nocardia pseudovaccinii]|uniref:TetR/AcrR family transcriptional regulator C-terminal domain-containing protein n=1 Tax=Nocardia pseudovaccinii TaxID=189540 RepID=UPI003D8D38AC
MGAAGTDRLLELAHRLRSALLPHRDGGRVFAGTFVRQSNTLAFGEAAICAALASGVPDSEAALAAFSVQYYVLGFVIEEQAAKENADRGEDRGEVDAERFPRVAAGSRTLRNTPRDVQFAYGLDRLVASLR